MAQKQPTTRLTIAELEKLLNSEDERPVEILPDGTIRQTRGRRKAQKVLTMKTSLGGEYGV